MGIRPGKRRRVSRLLIRRLRLAKESRESACTCGRSAPSHHALDCPKSRCPRCGTVYFEHSGLCALCTAQKEKEGLHMN